MLPETAKRANLQGSLKRFFKDNLQEGQNIHVSFDKLLTTPTVGGEKLVEWVGVKIGENDLDLMATQIIEVFCCTREDYEGYRLSRLRDQVLGLLTNAGGSTDTICRIPLYAVAESVADWERVGAFMVAEINESEEMEAPDLTKFITLSLRLRYASGV